MIRTRLTNIAPDTLHAMCCDIVACTYNPIDENELCDCRCNRECPVILPRFAKIGGEVKENDWDSFLFRVINATDTGVLELWKIESGGDVLKETLNNPAFGTEYPLGTFTNVTGQELYFGFKLDWESVLGTHGHGQYYVRANMTIFGASAFQFSDTYDLQEYSDSLANGTFVMRTIQNGNIRKSAFDFTGMEWEQYMRMNGTLWNRQPTFEIDEYLDENYKLTQVQDEIVDNFTLEIWNLIGGSLAMDVIYSRLLANEIFITDYNCCNAFEYCEQELRPIEFADVTHDGFFDGIAYVITFTDRYKDRFKRNFN